jgi:hypothetical protein
MECVVRGRTVLPLRTNKELIMQTIKGRQYVVGTVAISAAALARLAEMGVTPPKARKEYYWMYESFFLPEGEDGAEFKHRRGNVYDAGSLKLVGEA